MNKIFKVIWNEARNAYVVVSEIAKNHGSKSCSTKKLLAMLIATGVMTCASFDVLAAQPAAKGTAAQQYVALKAADFPATGPRWFNKDTWGGLGSYEEAKAEWDAQKNREKQIGNYTYALDKNKYWVRKGYVLTVDENGGKYTQLSDNAIRADVAYTGTGVPEGILQSVTSTVARNGVVTHSGDSLQKVTAGSYAGVSNSGGTEVAGSWNYIINDSSWENSGAEYKDGYVDLVDLKGDKMPRGFKTTDSGLNWDEVKQTYTYQGKAVDYRNMYVIDGKLGVFTNADGSEVYTGTVYGKHNEILMTVKDNGKFYSYWAASVTDPSVTMETYPVSKYNSDLAVIDKNIKDLNKDIIKEVTLTKGDDSAIIRLVRNGGNAVDGAITVTSGGGTGGSDAAHDTFVKISNGTTEQTFATGSKVEAIGSKDATTGIKINGEDYTIKSGSKVSVAQNDKTTTITVDGKATVITDTDTKYTKGNGIAIDKANAISVKLNKEEKNLVVDGSGLALNTALTGIQSITGAGEGKISFEGATVKVNQNTFNKDGRIQNVAKGTENTDAVNFGQLKETVAAGDTDVHIKAGNYTVDKDNKVSMNLVDKAGKSQGTVTITGVAKAEDVAVVYDKNKTSLRSTNATLQTSSGKEEAVDSIALGNGASAVKGSVAIGNGASVVEGSNGLGGVALGYKAHAGYKGTSLGSNAISGREGTTLVGANTNSGSLYTTVVGTDSVINSDGTEYNAIITSINVQGATATVVGSKNTVDNNNGLVYSGVANNVMGSANTIEGSNGVTIQGTGNKVTDAYKDMGITPGEAYSIYKGNYSALAKKQSGAIAVVGGANTVSKQTDSTVIGYDNRLIGGEENISHDVFMAGSHNTLNNVSDSIVMGNENAITGVSNVISFGHQNTISANNAVAIGNGAGVSVEGGVALGVGSVASTVAGALGYGAAEGETSIAWNATHGAVSVGSSVEGKEITRQITNVAAGTEDTDAVNVAQLKKVSEAAASASQGWKLKTQNGNASDVKPGATVEFDGDANIQVGNDGNKVSVTLKKQLTGIQSITGAGEGAGSISFADGGKVKVNDVIIEKGGKITGVADGKISADSKEAVNGSQLNAVKETANKGWNLSTNGDKASTKVATGARVDFSGAKDASGYQNIQVTNDGTNVKVALNKELKDLTSVTTNNAYVTNVDASKNESVTNVEYVKNQIADAALSAGDGISITDKKINVKLKEGEQNLVVNQDGLSLNTTLNGMAAINGAGGTINLAGDAITVNQNTFNKDGRIQNVANGTEKTDAVNYGQLQEVSNVANAGWNVSTNGGTATNVAPGAKVDFSGAKDASGYQNIQVT
uniref:ESPR-type extended signal peptide-containing protein n=1 Tax=Phascolarctobacterium succinatutens TaxID=626940 RepID=UPI0023F80C1B